MENLITLFKKRVIVLFVSCFTIFFVSNSSALTSTCIVNGGDWATAGTWDNGVPVAGVDAVIPAGFVPAISSNVACDNLTFSATSTATLTLGGNLTINGNLVFNQTGASNTSTIAAGTFTLSISGTVTFSTTGTSTISASTGTLTFGSAVTLGSLDKITFTGAGTANFNAGLVDGAGDLDVVSGTNINMGGDYTVNSGTVIWTTGANLIFTNTALFTPTSVVKPCNLTVTSGTLTLAGSITASGNWLMNSGTTLDNGGYAIIGVGSRSFTLSSGATLILTGTSTLPSGFGSMSLNTTSTVNYNGTGSQTIAAANYGNLTSSGSGARVLVSGGTIGISNTFTPGTNSYTITGSTVNYNGTTAQTITAFNYNNLTISGARTTNNITLANSGSIGVAAAFSATATFTSGAYVTTNSIFDFNGTGAQTITLFSYNNLTISGARTTNNISLPAGTINVADTFSPTATFTSGTYSKAANTINFNGTGAQTIPAFNYNNLTISGTRTTNNVTLVNGGVIGIAGTITLSATFSSGTYVNTNNTINFNSSSAQNVTIPASGFINNLAFNSSGTATLTNAITTSNVTGDVSVQSGTFSNGGFAIAGNSGKTFSVSNGAYFIVSKTSAMPTGFGTNTFGSSSTVDFIGPNSQTVDARNYGNLTISGTRNNQNVTLASGTIGVSGTFSTTAVFTIGAYFTTGNTINFNGSGLQTIPAFNYYNLTSSSTGARTLASSGTVGVAGAFTPGSNSYTITGSTINYNGTTAQTITAFNYNNLTVSGNRTVNNVTFANGGTVGVANSFTLSATFTSGNYILTNNTINFNGTGSQTVPVLSYNNLTTTNASTKTLAGSITANGAVTINSGSTLDASASNYGMIVLGNWVNNSGTFVPRSGTVTFSGTSTMLGSGVTNFNNVTISGALTGFSGNTNVAGNWVNDGTFTHNSGTITFNGTTTLSGSSTTPFYDIIISGTLFGHASNVNVAHNFTNNGTFTHNSGTVTFNGTTTISGSSTSSFNNVAITGTLTGPSSANINVAGNWTNDGAFVHNNGTVTFNGTSAMSGSSTNTFNNLTISGALTAPSANMNIIGTWTNNNAFTHNSGTVTFSGTTTIGGSATSTFNNVTISGTLTAHATSMGVDGNFVNDGTFNANNGSVTFGAATVSGSTTTTFKDIQINTSLTGHSNIMNISGNMINAGTYIGNGGLINFNGSTAQTISGGGTGDFENLGLNNSNGLTVTTGTYTLSGTIYITAGTLTNSGSFTLSADATRYARIDEISTFCGTCGFSGNFHVQRYLPSRITGVAWANLSSPVSNATMADWDADLFLVYPFIGFDTDYNRPTGTNVMAYDEPSANYTECSTSTPLSAGQGFEIALTDDETLASFAATTITSTGTPNFGDYDIPLSFTGANGPAYPTGYTGENLIGNPFASAIDFSLITITNALPSVDVYDYETNSYKTLSGSDLIGPHQGFWAYAQGTGASFFIPESAKSTNTTTDVERANKGKGSADYLNLTISTVDEADFMSHTLKVACNATALDGWDNSDHPFRRSLDKQAPSITAHAEKAIVSINTFNNNHETFVMPLQVKVGIDGRYRIRATNLSTITTDFSVVLLEDRLTKKFIDLTNVSEYMFDARIGDAQDRFVLHFSKLANYAPANTTITNPSSDIQISQNKGGNTIYFNNSEMENTTISVMDLLGKRIIGDISVEAFNQTVNIALPEGFHGMYIITVKSAKNSTVKKFNSF